MSPRRMASFETFNKVNMVMVYYVPDVIRTYVRMLTQTELNIAVVCY